MLPSAQKNKYLETSIQTANPAHLLIMLCDGAVRFCRMAVLSLQQQNLVEASRNLKKVEDIILEFVITLDKKSPIAEDLIKLYDYFIFRLKEANSTQTAEPAEEVLGYLIELKETWVQAAKGGSAAVGVKHG